ncbi:hypothetical protein C0J52_23394 [Blattella germanica]|nr:hypothetical protein C0J52_23394 [Blattella germanica]
MLNLGSGVNDIHFPSFSPVDDVKNSAFYCPRIDSMIDKVAATDLWNANLYLSMYNVNYRKKCKYKKPGPSITDRNESRIVAFRIAPACVIMWEEAVILRLFDPQTFLNLDRFITKKCKYKKPGPSITDRNESRIVAFRIAPACVIMWEEAVILRLFDPQTFLNLDRFITWWNEFFYGAVDGLNQEHIFYYVTQAVVRLHCEIEKSAQHSKACHCDPIIGVNIYFRINPDSWVTSESRRSVPIFRLHFNVGRHGRVPSRNTILLWVKNFRTGATALKKKPPGDRFV